MKKILNSHNKFTLLNKKNILAIIFVFLIILIPLVILISCRYAIDDINIYKKISIFLPIGFQLACMFIFLYVLKINFFKKNYFIFFLYKPILTIITLIINSIIAYSSQYEYLNNITVKYWTLLIDIGLLIAIELRTKILLKYFITMKFFKKIWTRTIIITITGVLTYFILQSGFNAIRQLIPIQSSNTNQSSIESGISTLFDKFHLFFSAVIIAPILEEIFYRYYVFYFSRNKIVGFICSILYFSSLHVIYNGDFENIFLYLSLSIINGYIYFRYKDLISCIFIHFLINLISYIVILSK